MWYVMPTGEQALREAAARGIRDRLEAIRCAAMLITRHGVGAQDRRLGRVILEQLELAELVLMRPGDFPLAAPRLPHPPKPTPATLPSARTEMPSL